MDSDKMNKDCQKLFLSLCPHFATYRHAGGHCWCFIKNSLQARQDRALWNGVFRSFVILLLLAAVLFSIFINSCVALSYGVRNSYLTLVLLSVALLCPLLAPFKGCTCSLLVFVRIP